VPVSTSHNCGVCVHVCMRVCEYALLHVRACLRTCVSRIEHTCAGVHACAGVRACVRVCISMCVHAIARQCQVMVHLTAAECVNRPGRHQWVADEAQLLRCVGSQKHAMCNWFPSAGMAVMELTVVRWKLGVMHAPDGRSFHCASVYKVAQGGMLKHS